MTSRVTVPNVDAAPPSDHDSDDRSDRATPPRSHDRERRERRHDRAERTVRRDNRPVPAEIKVKTVPHLLLTDPLRQYSR